jgi:hypothetical protein
MDTEGVFSGTNVHSAHRLVSLHGGHKLRKLDAFESSSGDVKVK